MKTNLSQVGKLGLTFLGFIAGAPAWSQTYPVKPVRLIVVGPPAGGAWMRRFDFGLGRRMFVRR